MLRFLCTLAITLAGPLSAQTTADSMRHGGHFVASIKAGIDSTQRYALLIPEGYRGDRRWPLLILMDPRGRALVPLDRFGPAAMRLGYVVMSSYNTASDQNTDPNLPAVNAMIADATRALAVDTTRFYLAGFSGTARVSWAFAAELRGIVRGIVSVGAGPPPSPPDWLGPFAGKSDFAVFGAAGRLDFNRDELVRLDREAHDRKVAHRIVLFDGRHEWLPESLATEALEWLDLQAATGPRRDSTLVTFAAARLADVESLGRAGDTLEAGRRFRSLTRELGQTDTVRAFLKRSDAARLVDRGGKALEREERRLEEDSVWAARTRRELGAIAGSGGATATMIAARIGLDSVRAAAGPQRPRDERDAARRRLEWLQVMTSFYDPRGYLARNDARAALVSLELARMIEPLGGREVCGIAHRAWEAARQAGEFPFDECR